MPFGSFHHIKIDVSSLDRSLHFYGTLLGFKQIVRYDRTDGVTIVQLSPTGEPPGIELWYEPPRGAFDDSRLHFAFDVQDVVGLVNDLRSRGVVVDTEVFQIGHEKIAFIRDPDGYLIELNEASARI
jgi:catechol 2,3-dioxygenase-like lactoylglutathione lyase family enzyme